MNGAAVDFFDEHAWRRGWERYGADMSDADHSAMARQIQDGKALMIGRKPGSKKLVIWVVWWPSLSRVVPVLYKAGKVRTVLPADVLSRRWASLCAKAATP